MNWASKKAKKREKRVEKRGKLMGKGRKLVEKKEKWEKLLEKKENFGNCVPKTCKTNKRKTYVRIQRSLHANDSNNSNWYRLRLQLDKDRKKPKNSNDLTASNLKFSIFSRYYYLADIFICHFVCRRDSINITHE